MELSSFSLLGTNFCWCAWLPERWTSVWKVSDHSHRLGLQPSLWFCLSLSPLPFLASLQQTQPPSSLFIRTGFCLPPRIGCGPLFTDQRLTSVLHCTVGCPFQMNTTGYPFPELSLSCPHPCLQEEVMGSVPSLCAFCAGFPGCKRQKRLRLSG